MIEVMKSGYWQSVYWSDRYWQDDYWPDGPVSEFEATKIMGVNIPTGQFVFIVGKSAHSHD